MLSPLQRGPAEHDHAEDSDLEVPPQFAAPRQDRKSATAPSRDRKSATALSGPLCWSTNRSLHTYFPW